MQADNCGVAAFTCEWKPSHTVYPVYVADHGCHNSSFLPMHMHLNIDEQQVHCMARIKLLSAEVSKMQAGRSGLPGKKGLEHLHGRHEKCTALENAVECR